MGRHRTLPLSVVLLAGLAGTAGYELNIATRQAKELNQIQQTIAALGGELISLQRDHATLVRDLKAGTQQLAALQPLSSASDAAESPHHPLLESWVASAKRLKRSFDERPEHRIPELQLLKEFDWLLLAKRADLDSEKTLRQALADARSEAKRKFSPRLQAAVKKYQIHRGMDAPPDLFALLPYFDPPVDRQVLERYEIADRTRISPIDITTGRLMESPWRLWEKAPIDATYDLRMTIVSNGIVSIARSW